MERYMKAPLSVCMIAKNEIAQLEKCILSFKDYISELVIVDTGSTDGTKEIAKKYADIYEDYTDCNDPETGLIEDFSKARQRSFDLSTQKWIMWVDADDIVDGAENLYEIIKKYENIKQNVMVMFPYEYSHDDKGNPTCVHYRERIINNKESFNWFGGVHEVILPKDTANTTMDKIDNIKTVHRRTSAKPMESGRNLRILKKMYEKMGDSDARQLYYLGLEYANNNDIENSNKFLHKYVELSGWDDEKCLAYLKMAENYIAQNKIHEAINEALHASRVQEKWGEPYFCLARCYYYLAMFNNNDSYRNWQRCAHYASMGLSFPETKTVLFLNPLERSFEIHRYYNVALSNTGDIDGALKSVNLALQVNPNDEQLNHNRKFYEKHISRININKEMNWMLSSNNINQESYNTIMSIFDGTSPVQINDSKNNDIWKIVKESSTELLNCYWKDNLIFKEEEENIFTKNNKLDIIFFVGDGLRAWNPDSVKQTGPVGGSELMEQQLAEGLAKLGHKVRLFNNPGNNAEGIYNGVEYHKTEKFHDLECDALVVSRFTNMLDDVYNIKAKIKLLHCHDVVAVNYTHKLGLNADRIIALSQWHKNNLVQTHNLKNEHVIVSRNGIDINRFKNKNIIKDQFKCINSSSPDRSWSVLLQDNVWSEIKRQVPSATLVLAYGFENWKIIAQANNDQKQLETIKLLEYKIDDLKSQGVIFKGKLTQEELSNEILSSSVNLYPTFFTETSCISAMENLISGNIIISSSIAALNETVGDKGILIDGEWTSKEYQDKFVKAAVNALNNTTESERLNLQKYAEEKFSLDNLYIEWEDMFYKLIEGKKINPIISYQPTKEYIK